MTLKVYIYIFGLTKCTIYCKKTFLFLFLFFCMLLLCSFFRLKELFQVKNGLTTSLLFVFFENAKYLGRSDDAKRRKEDGLWRSGLRQRIKYGDNSLVVLTYFLFFLFLKFSEIIFVDHQKGNKAYFKRRSHSSLTAASNYNSKSASTFGLWDGQGVNKNYSYQLLICHQEFYSGFFVSGYTNCFKKCDNWCYDTTTPYFRTASTDAKYNGVAFNINGHYPHVVENRLISVGLRQTARHFSANRIMNGFSREQCRGATPTSFFFLNTCWS